MLAQIAPNAFLGTSSYKRRLPQQTILSIGPLGPERNGEFISRIGNVANKSDAMHDSNGIRRMLDMRLPSWSLL